MENLVLSVLSFDLSVPTILSFLNRYEKAANVPSHLSQKFSYLTKVSIFILSVQYILYIVTTVVSTVLHCVSAHLCPIFQISKRSSSVQCYCYPASTPTSSPKLEYLIP